MARTIAKAKKCTGGTAPTRAIYKPTQDDSSRAMAVDDEAPDAEPDLSAVGQSLSFLEKPTNSNGYRTCATCASMGAT
jgi:hypothetical protein